jgi:hypothetical protein
MSEARVNGGKAFPACLSQLVPLPQPRGASSTCNQHAHRMALYFNKNSLGSRLHAGRRDMAERCRSGVQEWIVITRRLILPPCPLAIPRNSEDPAPRCARRMHFNFPKPLGIGLYSGITEMSGVSSMQEGFIHLWSPCHCSLPL